MGMNRGPERTIIYCHLISSLHFLSQLSLSRFAGIRAKGRGERQAGRDGEAQEFSLRERALKANPSYSIKSIHFIL